MPTPFMHLQIAEAIRSRVHDGGQSRLLSSLEQAWPAFYLGSVAPDYQTICNVPRASTHFYDLPPAPEDLAYPKMLVRYPELAAPGDLSLDHAMFVAAYSAHLMLDLLWFRQVLMPYFVKASGWGEFPQRLLVHHIVLAYLDKMAFDSLPAAAGETLAHAQPTGWLPFATDAELVNWRDMLTVQMQPGATMQTIAIYAERLHMSPAEFEDKLRDPNWMQTEVFDNVPVSAIKTKLEASVPDCIELITEYLKLN